MADTATNAAAQAKRMRVMALLYARDPSLETRNISHRVIVNAPPATVYAALLDSKRHAAITGTPVSIDPEVGGEFSTGDGFAAGLVGELLENRHLVIACAVNVDGWPPNHYGTATIIVKPEGSGTAVTFFQQDVPAAARDAAAQGWDQRYFSRLPAAFASGSD